MFRLLLLHKIEDSRFQSAETEIKSGYLRFGKYKRFGVPVLGIAVDQRSARIRKSKDFGRFVERFARGIVECLAQQFHLEVVRHQDQLRMPPRYRKAQEREFGNRFFDKVRENVCLHVVYLDKRDIPCKRKGLSEGCPHQ